MSRSLSYIFPAGNTTDICQEQSVGEAAPLVLNGNLVDSITNQVSFISRGYARSISITSANNLSGVDFTVLGTQNGITIEEVLTGPNNSTVYSDSVFDVITSVTTNDAANDVSVGSGWKGFFSLIAINLEKDVINYGLTIAKLTTDPIPFSLYASLVNINQLGLYIDSLTSSLIFSITENNTNSNYHFSSSDMWNSILIKLGDDNASIANSMQLNFIQT